MRIRTHVNPLCCTKRFEKLDPSETFSDFNEKLDLEIGFGQSLFIKAYAQNNPQRFIVGVEVRQKAVEIVQKRLESEKLENIKLVHGTGEFCLQDMFDDKTIDRIFIFHPDPWIKNRHRKRRVINSDFLELAKKKLKVGGKIYVSTDVQDLWNEISSCFANDSSFEPFEDEDFWQNYYSTRWHDIAVSKNRQTFYATFKLKK